jgi:hypothetical protein
MAEKLRQLVVNGGLKPPGINRDAANERIRGCFADMNQAGVRVGEVASHH